MHRASADARRRRRHRQLPEPVAARVDQVRDQHGPHRSQPDPEAAHLRALQLVRPEQQLQQLLRQPGHRRVVQVHLAAVRLRSRLRARFDDGAEPALRLQLLRARHGHEPGQPRLRSDVARFPASYARRFRRHPPLPALRHHRLPGHGIRRRVSSERDQLVHRHHDQVEGLALAPHRHGDAGATPRHPSSSPTTRPASSTSTPRGRAGRSTTRPVRTRSGSRLPPSCSGCQRRAPCRCRRAYDEASSTWGFYLQDDWKAGDRLTLNLGLRYECETALVEADNKSVRGFD